METVISYQLYQFMAAMITGGGLGIIYNFWKPFHKLSPSWARSIVDFLYFLFSVLWVFLFYQGIGCGDTRLLFFLGIGCGLGLYFITIGPMLQRDIRALEVFFRHMIRKTGNAVLRTGKKGKKVEKILKKYLCKSKDIV